MPADNDQPTGDDSAARNFAYAITGEDPVAPEPAPARPSAGRRLWQRHYGTDRPVEAHTLIDVELRSGLKCETTPAGAPGYVWRWIDDPRGISPADVKRWRFAKPADAAAHEAYFADPGPADAGPIEAQPADPRIEKHLAFYRARFLDALDAGRREIARDHATILLALAALERSPR